MRKRPGPDRIASILHEFRADLAKIDGLIRRLDADLVPIGRAIRRLGGRRGGGVPAPKYHHTLAELFFIKYQYVVFMLDMWRTTGLKPGQAASLVAQGRSALAGATGHEERTPAGEGLRGYRAALADFEKAYGPRDMP